MPNDQVAASDWTDNDLLTIADAIVLLADELAVATVDVAQLRASGAPDSEIQSAERRRAAIETRHANLVGTPNA